MAKGRGGGITPERVVKLIRDAVVEKSQSAVARESGLTLSTVQRCLKGIGEPTHETYQKLAEYFNVSVPWLRGEEYEEAKKNIDKAFLEEIIKFVDGYYLQKNIYITFKKRAKLYAELYFEFKSKGGSRKEYLALQDEGEQLLKKLQENL